jgi:hypothetical protein
MRAGALGTCESNGPSARIDDGVEAVFERSSIFELERRLRIGKWLSRLEYDSVDELGIMPGRSTKLTLLGRPEEGVVMFVSMLP